MYRTPWVIIALLSLCSTAQAKDLCEEYANYSPLPKWYTEVCNGPVKRGLSKIGGAYSSFGDAFNLNPASIPTVKTPLGVEYINSFSGGTSKRSVAIIKGFGHVGTALTTNSDETFYGNSVFQTPSGQTAVDANGNVLPPPPSTSTNIPTFNLGSALSIDSILNMKKLIPFDFASNLGIVAKYNQSAGTFTNGLGVGFGLWKFSFGLSITRDPRTTYTPEVDYTTFTAGFKTSFCQIEFVTISSHSLAQTMYDPSGNSIGLSRAQTYQPAKMLTFSSKIGGFMLVAAARAYQDVVGVNYTQYHAAVEYIVSPKVALQYLNNYVVNHQSIGLQVLF